MTKFSKIFFIAILFLGLFGLAQNSEAANQYIRAGATGNGSDWTNAYASLPATLVRGNTYYIAGGSYPSYMVDDAVSGTSVITIKKATIADHGAETGWDSSYGDGQAVFGKITIQASYITIDGTSGSLSSDSSSYGIKVTPTNCSQANRLIDISSASTLSYNIIKHIALVNCGSSYDYYQTGIFVLASSTNIQITDNYFSGGNVNLYINGCSNCVAERNYFDTNWSSSNNHGGQIVPANAQNLIIRNSTFRNSTVYLVGGHVTACSLAYEINGGGHYGGGAWTFTATILTDTTKSWVPNQYVGYTLSRNHNGSSAYSSWTITANTANTITVNNTPYDLNVGNVAAHGALDEGDIYWITMTGTVSNIADGSFSDSSRAWTKDVTANTYQLGITHSGSATYYRISSIVGNTINVLPPILVSNGNANGDTYLIKSCIAPSDNLQFYNNIVIGNGTASQHSGIISADSAYTDVLTNLKVYNNTFYNVGIASMGWMFTGVQSDTSKKAIGKNNLFYNCVSPTVNLGRYAGTFEKSYNAYLKCTGTIPAVGSETGMQRDDSASNPFLSVLQEDFRLILGSLAINNGIDLGSPYNVDKAETTRPQGSAWDIGAYEYVSGIVDITPPAPPMGVVVQ